MTKLSPIKATPYMSVVEGRTPRQKVHTHLTHAKNAFDTPKHNDLVPGRGQYTHGWGAIFEHINGNWEQIIEIPQPTADDAVHKQSGRYSSTTFETRPWRTNDNRQPVPAVRSSSHPQAEPEPGAHQDLGRVHEGADERGRPGDDQRASRSSDDHQGGLTRREILDEAHRASVVAETACARWSDKGWPADKEQMLQMRARRDALMWVAERMPDGTANTKPAE